MKCRVEKITVEMGRWQNNGKYTAPEKEIFFHANNSSYISKLNM